MATAAYSMFGTRVSMPKLGSPLTLRGVSSRFCLTLPTTLKALTGLSGTSFGTSICAALGAAMP